MIERAFGFGAVLVLGAIVGAAGALAQAPSPAPEVGPEEEPAAPWPPHLAAVLGLQPVEILPGDAPWEPSTCGSFTVFTASTLAKGEILLQPFLYYRVVRGSYDARGDYDPLPASHHESSVSIPLLLQYGLFDHVEVDAQIEIVHNYAEQGSRHASSTGLADSFLFARYALLLETNGWTPAVTALMQLKLPTGKADRASQRKLGTDLTADGTTELTFALDFNKAIRVLVVHAEAAYSHPFRADLDGVRVEGGDAVAWALGVEVPFLDDRLAALLELSGYHQENGRQDGDRLRRSGAGLIVAEVGLELIGLEELQLMAGYQRAIWGKNEVAFDGFVATFLLYF